MTNVEIFSIISSCTSIILAIVAIALSVFFFRMSSLLSESTKDASKSISAGVERLKKMFNTLYSDNFSMMKEAYSDMRKHVWPEENANTDKITEEAEIKANKKINLLKGEINKELSKMFRKQEMTDTKLSSIRNEVQNLIDKTISSSRRVDVEAREETIRNKIKAAIRALQKQNKTICANDVVELLVFGDKLNSSKVIEEMIRMSDEGVISHTSSEHGRKFGANTIIIQVR